MGCHTWFLVPYKKDKEEIIGMAKAYLDNWIKDGLSDSSTKMYKYAIENELIDPILDLAAATPPTTLSHHGDGWILYMDVQDYSLMEYNKKNGTKYESIYDEAVRNHLERYSDEPRISGYPEKIIHSYDEMVDFMESGFDDVDGEHHDFSYDEERKPIFLAGIKSFFEKHPDGIIHFG